MMPTTVELLELVPELLSELATVTVKVSGQVRDLSSIIGTLIVVLFDQLL